MKNMQVRFRNMELPGFLQTWRKLFAEIQVEHPGTCSPMRSLPALLLSSLSEHRVSARNACKRNAVKKKIKYCLKSSEESCCGVWRSEKFHNCWLQPEEGFFTRKEGFSGYSLAVVCVISLGKKGGGKGRLCFPAREIWKITGFIYYFSWDFGHFSLKIWNNLGLCKIFHWKKAHLTLL